MSDSLLEGFAIPRRRHSALLIFVVCSWYIFPSISVAQDWQVRPPVALNGEFNDNIRLDNDGTQNAGQDGEVTGGVLRAGVRLSRRSPTGIVRFDPSIRTPRYGADADSDDYFLYTFSDIRITDDSGLVTVENGRNRFVLGPSVEFELSPQASLRFLGHYVDAGYDSGTGSPADYTSSHIEGRRAYTRQTFPDISIAESSNSIYLGVEFSSQRLL